MKKLGFCLAMLLVATSCKKKEEPKEVVKEEVIEVEKPEPVKKEINIKPGTFLSKLTLANMSGDENTDYNLDEVKNYSQIEQGNFDIAVVPGYLVPYFYQQTDKGIEIAAITGTGNVYMVNDKQIDNQMDYRGKNLYIPDLAGNLSKIIDEKIGPLNLIMRLNVEYYKSIDAIIKKMETGTDYITILPEPYYSSAIKDKNLYMSNIEDLLPIGSDDFISEVVIVNKDYLKTNKEDFDKFLDDYKNATEEIISFKNRNKDSDSDAVITVPDELLKAYNLNNDDLDQVIDHMDIRYVDGKQMQEDYQKFMDKLSQVDEKLLGNQKPGDDMFYKEK